MKQLNEMSDVELKALAYDVVVELERAQKNLQVINQEFARRQQQSANIIKPVEEIKKSE